jgi:hypothetical protein
MKKLFFLISVLCAATVFGQDKPKEVTSEFYGFVRFESFFDSYKGLNAGNELFFIAPNFVGLDSNGKHINETPTYNFASMATRLGVRMVGPTILNAKTTANIEADFAGDLANNPALFRVRQANMTFTWAKSSLLVGQTWHPFWSGKVFPTVAGLNTGCPFQPFNRSPQIRFDYKPTSKLILTAAAVGEFQYKSFGFSKIETYTIEKADVYSRNGGIPELIANIEVNNGGCTLGAGASMKYILPTLYTVGTSGKFVSDDKVKAVSFVGYGQYVKKLFTIRAKATLGQNMTHLNIPGGYGIKSLDKATGALTYTPYNSFSSYINAIYGKKYQVGFFGGYMKNLGTVDALYNFGTSSTPSVVTPGLLPNVASMYRVAPHFAANISKLRFIFEYEITTAKYGTGNIDISDGLYASHINATNKRALLVLMYSF